MAFVADLRKKHDNMHGIGVRGTAFDFTSLHSIRLDSIVAHYFAHSVINSERGEVKKEVLEMWTKGIITYGEKKINTGEMTFVFHS